MAPGRLVHYLHPDAHRYHFGDADPMRDVERGVRLPLAEAPAAGATGGDPSWQSDGATVVRSPSLFSLLDELTR